MPKIYLDHAATTSVDKEVLKTMMPYFGEKFGNPSSIHQYGQEARHAVDGARTDIANLINSSPEEIIFTSGGSEADNLAIRGIIEKVIELYEQKFLPHVIISAIEHKAVLETVKKLEKEGKISVTCIKPDKNGRISENTVKKVIKPRTTLVSIMYVNNETGVIQPIRETGKMIEKLNKKRKEKIYFHTDAVQAAGYLDLNVEYLHVDLMTLSAHKIYGPKGIGLLYLKKGTPISAQIIGGEQENGRRAGTENVAGIVGMAIALQESRSKNQEARKIQKLKDYFEDKIIHEIPDVLVNGQKTERAPHISNLSFKGAEGESILLSLDLEGIAASSGSACTSGSLEPSHVLMAMGVKPFDVQSSIRFSFGKDNSKKEVDYTISKLKKIIKRLKKLSPI